MAGWNAILSLGGAALIAWLLCKAAAHDAAGAPATGGPTARRCCASTRPANMARRASMPASWRCSAEFAGGAADRADGGAGRAPPRPVRPADGRAAGPPDRAAAVWNVAGFALGAATALMSRRRRRWPAPMRSRPRSTAIMASSSTSLATSDPELAADIAEFRAEELEHRDTARDAWRGAKPSAIRC